MDLRAALLQNFGFPDFRPGQEAVVAAACDPEHPRDVLVVMPTGAGKSLTYQLPALIGDGLTLVVSPLVSLMADQVQALERIAPGRAALLSGQQDAAEQAQVLTRARGGELRLLYVAPERFSSRSFLNLLKEIRIELFVVDEAHCVSQWGHDFRPDYFRLGDAARWLGAPQMIAATATATPKVARDIAVRLGLRTPLIVATGFDRPNIAFAVAGCRTSADKHARIAQLLAEPDATPAIVYAGTRKRCDELASRLQAQLGRSVISYHAGLARDARADAQDRFMSGAVDVVVATNAFGMGVDKADVRTVVHETVPPSVEAYYQEAGRAGRDGRPARAVLFAEPRDKGLHVYFIERAEVGPEQLDRAVRQLLAAADAGAGRIDVDFREIDDEPDRARAIVGHLVRAGVLRPAPSAPDRFSGRFGKDYDAATRALALSSAREGLQIRWQQYRAIWGFVEADTCRRELLLRHFGDEREPAPSGPCCDVCVPELVPSSALRVRGANSRASGRSLRDAIVSVVRAARPSIGRSKVADVLRGSRAQAVLRNSWDGLPEYGQFAHLSKDDVLAQIDEMLDSGELASSGGPYPVLSTAAVAGEQGVIAI